jgi:predicted glycogen debranching enzyme
MDGGTVMFKLEGDQLSDLSGLLRAEWLETNGLGGYAMGTAAGARTRRYHGLLCAALRPPVERRMMLQGLECELRSNGQREPLGTNLYADAVHPQGWRSLVEFRRDPWPIWTYEAAGARVEQAVFMPHGRNATVITFRCLQAAHPLTLTARILMAPRDHHHLVQASVDFDPRVEMSGGDPTLHFDGQPPLLLEILGGDFWPHADWYYRFNYVEEQLRGLDHFEDLYMAGCIEWSLREGETVGVVASVDGPLGADPAEVEAAERGRRQALADTAPEGDEVARALFVAADQFLVKRPDQGADACSIIAGYPWFSDWGRDAMIALPGLLLSTGRHEEALAVIRAFAAAMRDGLVPNLFADQGAEAIYNTVDATLWFFAACRRYVDATGNLQPFADGLFARMKESIAAHIRGTSYGIRVDTDGLLAAGDETTQLTWMDAKVGDWVVTPRHGKAVEINALWYSALKTMEFLARKLGENPAPYTRMARGVKEAFVRTFWSEELGYLYDCVRGEERDGSLRPNQVIALSLPYTALSVAQERAVLRVVTEKLLTPFGLRTLSPDDNRYRGRYQGDVWERDGAYHQGTAWPWLLGPFLSAYLIHAGHTEEARAWVRELLRPMLDGLLHGGMGQIAEIYDGDVPQAPRGCPAQAWSVSEILRVWVESGLGGGA